jgi:hypothetical protein
MFYVLGPSGTMAGWPQLMVFQIITSGGNRMP